MSATLIRRERQFFKLAETVQTVICSSVEDTESGKGGFKAGVFLQGVHRSRPVR